MSVDKNYCMSSYLAFRYIEKLDVDFFDGLHHENFAPHSVDEKISVRSHLDIDREIQRVFDGLQGKKLGILLSGGMDSGSLAAYMPGGDAYTFRFLGGTYQKEELQRAEYFAEKHGLNLHYVDISWESIEDCIDPVIRSKNAPVHSIEPQIYKAALQARADGIEHMIVGESADLNFGGMDQLLSRDWAFDDFVKRYTFTEPKDVLCEPADVGYLFERYRDGNGIKLLEFMDGVFSIESPSSYLNAFGTAEMPYTDPFARLKMAEPLDLVRVRNGEPKYLIRELFASKYPEIPIPDKIPMPRPVDTYFSNWDGPTRPKFKRNLDMSRFTGNQKWQLWCLERFLNLYEPL